MEPIFTPQQIVDRSDQGWRFSSQSNPIGRLSRLSSEVLSQIVWHLNLAELLSFSVTCRGASELARCYIFFTVSFLNPTKKTNLISWFSGNGEDPKGIRNCVHQLIVKNSEWYSQAGIAKQHQARSYESCQKLLEFQSKVYSNLITKLPNLISFKWMTHQSCLQPHLIDSLQSSHIRYLHLSGFNFPGEVPVCRLAGLVSLVICSQYSTTENSVFISGFLNSSHSTLEHIHINSSHYVGNGLECIEFPKLKTLHLKFPNITENLLKCFIPTFTKIKSLTLMGNVSKWERGGWPELKYLRLSGMNTEPLYEILSSSPNIETLLLEDHMSLSQMKQLFPAVNSLGQLRTLKITKNSFHGLETFPDPKKLENLWLHSLQAFEIDHTQLSNALGHLDLVNFVLQSDGEPRIYKPRTDSNIRSATIYHLETWKKLEYFYFYRCCVRILRDGEVVEGINLNSEIDSTPTKPEVGDNLYARPVPRSIMDVFGYPNETLESSIPDY